MVSCVNFVNSRPITNESNNIIFSGVHHRKRNCESNQVISKVQQVLKIATRSGQLFPKSLTLTVASILKKTKSRKGNGGWGDRRDHSLCLNMTFSTGFIKSKTKL